MFLRSRKLMGGSILTGLILLSFQQQIAFAKELDELAEFVRPAYTTMNLSLMCSKVDHNFLYITSGPRGTALQYAQHVKDEAIFGLNDADAAYVLRIAANAARSEARAKLHELVQLSAGQDINLAVERWCLTDGRRMIFDFVQGHDHEHHIAEKFLERVKDNIRR